MIKTETILYNDAEVQCEGFLAYDDEKTPQKRPCILVHHAWAGQGDFERQKAQQLASLGYVAFAVDVFGKGVRGDVQGDNSKLIHPFMDDRAMLRSRLLAGLNAAKQIPQADATRLGAIGFCFGGLCVLDLARASMPELKGVVSFHGLLQAPEIGEQKPIPTKILIEHGYSDPMATPDKIVAIGNELTAAQADWQLHAYGNTQHGFMAPAANNKAAGIVYQESTAKRAWLAMENFFEEVFPAS